MLTRWKDILFKFRIHLLNEVQDLIPPQSFYGAGHKMLRQELPGLAHLIQKVLDVLRDGTLIFLIGLGEDEAEGDFPFAELVYKFKVQLLR